MTTCNPILEKMLDRLYGAMMRGPQLSCSPHNRRQRVDLKAFERLQDGTAERMLRELLSPASATRVRAVVPMPTEEALEREKRRSAAVLERRRRKKEGLPVDDLLEEEPVDPEVEAWQRRQALLSRLRHLGEDARIYTQETGVEALEVGYPLLSLPPGSISGGKRRILAPVAFVGCRMTVRSSGRARVELECRSEDVERVVPNIALFAWLGRELGTRLPDDLFADETGEDPWREIAELTRLVADELDLEELDPEGLDLESWTDPERLVLRSTPRTSALPSRPTLLPSAVFGLFPASNQGLLRDTRELLDRNDFRGPVRSFLFAGTTLDDPAADADDGPRDPAADRLVLPADPMQAQAVRLARRHRGLVVHGPPGTGKSQTIANMIGDHLARGERVLFVCDKRTALDVVANRLKSLELDAFCAVVHDPRRDRRNLFMKVRERLDRLPELLDDDRASAELDRVDIRIRELHGRLEKLRSALLGDPGDAARQDSFHHLTGRLLALGTPGRDADDSVELALPDLSPSAVDIHRESLERIFERGLGVGCPRQPWLAAAGGTLQDFMAVPLREVDRRLEALVETARRTDAERSPAVEPFDGRPTAEQVEERERLLELLTAAGDADLADRRKVAELGVERAKVLRDRLVSAAEERTEVRTDPLYPELVWWVGPESPPARERASLILKLETYLDTYKTWWGFLRFGERSAGREALETFGLGPSPESAETVLRFLRALQTREGLAALLKELRGSTVGLSEDHELLEGLDQYERLLTLRLEADGTAFEGPVREALEDAEADKRLMASLGHARARAAALDALEEALPAAGLLDQGFIAGLVVDVRRGEAAAPPIEALAAQARHLEEVHRLRADLERLPDELRAGVDDLLGRGIEPADALASLERRALGNALRDLLASEERLAGLDERAVETDLETLRRLLEQKRELVLRAVHGRWIGLQRDRLLASTGTKLNAVGASVRRRLFVRGRQAMKLRQVLKVGRNSTYTDGGGDPLFDLCPVWMCSPETVAQIFPLEETFDVVIFDEASQCRLEEALPVLVRARRLVIAGDPHQLPPTRFFEAAVTGSETKELETEDDLFEAQQGDIEDLLGAALQLDVQESYLDVHYRSRHSTLIEFSNRHFYGHRLQALPGHPDDLPETAPIRLHPVGGVYDKRTNRAEAEAVVVLVEELLAADEPPSVGIATFNLVQRDLVADLLAEKAETDRAFRERYEAARGLERDGSFEGLFVKNLENVQGDERDHIVISTTYGLDAEGKFYRRFGPLGSAGGGRRLNVLVTRAREQLHVVTSIPPSVYHAYAALPADGRPTGSWLLLAYLRYAEKADAWARLQQESHRDPAEVTREAERLRRESLEVRSPLVEALADHLASSGDAGSTVESYWGNDGFCVDLTVAAPGERRRGLLLDFARYRRAPDPVEWDLFATGLLRSHGWSLKRLFSPRIFRDPERVLRGVHEDGGGSPREH